MKKLLPPLLVALFSRLFFSGISISYGQRPWTPAPWIRWDSNLYLDIARKGYEFVSCRQIGFASINDACGNTGWFPGYPLLVSIFHLALGWLSVSYEACAVLVPFLFFFFILALIWNRFLDSELNVKNILVLSIAAFFPGCIFFQAAFPISVTGFFVLALIHCLQEERWRKAWISGFLAGIAYPTGFIVGGFPLIYYFLRKNLRLAIALWLSGLVGFGSVILFQGLQTGVWGAFFQVQRKYGYTERGPLRSLYEDLTSFGTDGIHLQSTAVAIYMVGLIAFLAWKRKTGKAGKLDWAILVGSAGYWLIPHILGGRMTSFSRAELLIFPSVVLLKDAPKPVLVGVLIVFVALAYLMGGLFFQNLLV